MITWLKTKTIHNRFRLKKSFNILPPLSQITNRVHSFLFFPLLLTHTVGTLLLLFVHHICSFSRNNNNGLVGYTHSKYNILDAQDSHHHLALARNNNNNNNLRMEISFWGKQHWLIIFIFVLNPSFMSNDLVFSHYTFFSSELYILLYVVSTRFILIFFNKSCFNR